MNTLQKNLSNKVSIGFYGESVGDQGLDVSITVNGQTIKSLPNLIGQHSVEFYQSYPMSIEISVNGKKPNDTKIDQDGNIVKDTHVLVSSLHLSGIPVKKWMLEKFVIKHNDMFTNYLGFNGVACINLPKKDAFDNHLYLLAQSNSG